MLVYGRVNMDVSLRKIHLVRHAESIWNRERRIQGTCLDVPLSEEGKTQALKLGRRLRTFNCSAVYSSDAERALATARIAMGNGHPVQTSPGLRELSLGEWEGRLISELREESPEQVEAWYRRPAGVRLKRGEDLHAFRDRVVETMEGIIGSSGTGDVIVVTHGGVICSYITHLFNMDLDDLWSFCLANASITTLVLDFRIRLRTFGDTSHLDDGEALDFDGILYLNSH